MPQQLKSSAFAARRLSLCAWLVARRWRWGRSCATMAAPCSGSCRRSGESYDEAKDLTQETFLAALALADSFDGSCSVTTWLCSLANIMLGDHLRRVTRQKRIPRSKLIEIDAKGAEAIARLWAGSIGIALRNPESTNCWRVLGNSAC